MYVRVYIHMYMYYVCVCVMHTCMHDEWMGGWMSARLYHWYENNIFGPLKLFLCLIG